MESGKTYTFLHLLPLFLLFSTPFAIGTNGDASERKTYIVHVRPPESIASATSTANRESYYKSFLPMNLQSLAEPPRMLYAYTNVASAFAARLTEQELAAIAKKDGFLHAQADRLYPLQTTRTPEFFGLNPAGGVWNVSNFGEGVIIGMLDTGVFPDHPSFSGYGIPPPPSKWKGLCEFNASQCNNKLIGARAFVSGAAAMGGVSATSPIDDDGHGTHTASTAAGAMVQGAQALGNAAGVATGMAPKAHLAIYKVCGEVDCASSDILAGLDAAIADGVDVLSLSIGDVSHPFYDDTIAVGAFSAMEKGVFVSCAAGNSGPNASTLSNEAPWLLTVAASTMDRSVRATVKLGNGLELDGESLFQPKTFLPTLYPLVYAGAGSKPGAAFCGNGSLDSAQVKGKIVLCERGNNIPRIEKGLFVKSAGGIGMILTNQEQDGYSTLVDAHLLPASHVSYVDGLRIKEYINSSTRPTAAIVFKGTVIGTSPAPAITSFSSRGPSLASPGILKPDVTGPGVSVLAAWPFPVGPSPVASTAPTFNVESGTSMSTPHLSGIAALIKAAHPDWSPAAIKSAMMTTADVLDHSGMMIVDERRLPADLFAVGAGHVNPTKASDPGLVYDLGVDDYIAYLCGLGYTSAQVSAVVRRPIDCTTVEAITEGELNYPSISGSFGPSAGSITFERRVKNVGEATSTYRVEIDPPPGVSMSVEPAMLSFSRLNEEQQFRVTFSSSNTVGGARVLQGSLKWVSSKYVVRSPISVTFKN